MGLDYHSLGAYAYRSIEGFGCPFEGPFASINDVGQVAWWEGWGGDNYIGLGDATGRLYRIIDSALGYPWPVLNDLGQIAFASESYNPTPHLDLIIWSTFQNSFADIPYSREPYSIDDAGSVTFMTNSGRPYTGSGSDLLTSDSTGIYFNGALVISSSDPTLGTPPFHGPYPICANAAGQVVFYVYYSCGGTLFLAYDPRQAPAIVVNPSSASVPRGSNVTFTVAAAGAPTLHYQWLKEQAHIAGATNARLTITNVQASDVADYSVFVQNPYGSATSTSASLHLYTPTSLAISAIETPWLAGSSHTFISTDVILVKATVSPPAPNIPLKWTVIGLQAAQGIPGFPGDELHLTDSQGVSTFTFIPEQNGAFAQNRSKVWTTGSRAPNYPVGFEVVCQLELDGAALLASTSDVGGLAAILQDETDTLRQEYVDFQIPLPARSDIVQSLGVGYNKGNYGVQISVNLVEHFNAILAKYRGSTVSVNGGSVSIPQDADLCVSSGFRNPRRNVAIGSKYTTGTGVSKHVLGRALDIQPVGRHRPPLSLHDVIFPALLNAAQTQADDPQHPAITESGAKPVQVGDPTEDHVHVQWQN
jgi:hypothetical protein